VHNPDGFFAVGNGEVSVVYGIGLYTFEDRFNRCFIISYDDTEPFWTDPKLNSARSCGTIASAIGFAALCWMWCALCCDCARFSCVRVTYGLSGLAASILSGLMLLFYQSYICTEYEGKCEFSQGGIYTVISLLLYFSSAVLSFLSPRDTRYSVPAFTQSFEHGGAGQVTVTVETTNMSDGTIVTKTTTTNPDGTTTIEEKREVPDSASAGTTDIESMPQAQIN